MSSARPLWESLRELFRSILEDLGSVIGPNPSQRFDSSAVRPGAAIRLTSDFMLDEASGEVLEGTRHLDHDASALAALPMQLTLAFGHQAALRGLRFERVQIDIHTSVVRSSAQEENPDNLLDLRACVSTAEEEASVRAAWNEAQECCPGLHDALRRRQLKSRLSITLPVEVLRALALA
jgi:hypothetical protein